MYESSSVTVYKGNTQTELGRFDPGTMEADLWQELMTPNAKGRLLRSNGVRVTQGSTAVAQGSYHFHAEKSPTGQGQSRGRGGIIHTIIYKVVDKARGK